MSLKLRKDFDAVFLIDKVFQEKGFYVYNTHNIGEKGFSVSIAPVRSQGGPLV
jgi:hypothetical protein